ncbi:MAG: transposase, partial [Sandaracinaceae bacterium]
AAREAIAQELEAQLAEARAEIRKRGWKVMGPTRARNVSPYRRAKTFEARGTLRPHVAAGPGQTEARIAAIEQLVEFREKHREAKRRWCAGDRDVVFPAGTYWMVKHHGARVEPFT